MNCSKDNSASAPRQQNVDLPSEYVGCFKTPYGTQHIRQGEAIDHANMLSAQLTGLIMMMTDEGATRFHNLSPHLQENLMWLASEMSSQLGAMFDIVASDVHWSKQ